MRGIYFQVMVEFFSISQLSHSYIEADIVEVKYVSGVASGLFYIHP